MALFLLALACYRVPVANVENLSRSGQVVCDRNGLCDPAKLEFYASSPEPGCTVFSFRTDSRGRFQLPKECGSAVQIRPIAACAELTAVEGESLSFVLHQVGCGLPSTRSRIELLPGALEHWGIPKDGQGFGVALWIPVEGGPATRMLMAHSPDTATMVTETERVLFDGAGNPNGIDSDATTLASRGSRLASGDLEAVWQALHDAPVEVCLDLCEPIPGGSEVLVTILVWSGTTRHVLIRSGAVSGIYRAGSLPEVLQALAVLKGP